MNVHDGADAVQVKLRSFWRHICNFLFISYFLLRTVLREAMYLFPPYIYLLYYGEHICVVGIFNKLLVCIR